MSKLSFDISESIGKDTFLFLIGKLMDACIKIDSLEDQLQLHHELIQNMAHDIQKLKAKAGEF